MKLEFIEYLKQGYRGFVDTTNRNIEVTSR